MTVNATRVGSIPARKSETFLVPRSDNKTKSIDFRRSTRKVGNCFENW